MYFYIIFYFLPVLTFLVHIFLLQNIISFYMVLLYNTIRSLYFYKCVILAIRASFIKLFHRNLLNSSLSPGDDNVWKEVYGMADPIEVKYDKIESLFCQKTIDKNKKEEVKAKPPTEVSMEALNSKLPV